MFVFLRPEGLLLSKDQTGAAQLDTVIYRSIKCLNLHTIDSFYFKSNKSGYAFFFRAFNPNDAHRIYENLIVLIDKEVETRSEIQPLSMGSTFTPLVLDAEEPDFRYKYGRSRAQLAEQQKKSGTGSELVNF